MSFSVAILYYAQHFYKRNLFGFIIPNWVNKLGFIAFAFSLAFVGIDLISVFGIENVGCIKLQIINKVSIGS